jgi:hypothetical protein
METMKPARATHRDQTMAKNFIQPGRVVTLVAPTGGVLSGQAVQVGALFGIAAYDALGGRMSKLRLKGSGSFRRRPSPLRGARRSFGTRRPATLPPTDKSPELFIAHAGKVVHALALYALDRNEPNTPARIAVPPCSLLGALSTLRSCRTSIHFTVRAAAMWKR